MSEHTPRDGRDTQPAKARENGAALAAAVKEGEDRLRALSDNLPGGFVYQIEFEADLSERRFTYISEGVEQLHEVSVEEALRDPGLLYGQLVEEDRAVVERREREALSTMAPFSAEVRVVLPSGRTGWRLLTSAPRRLPCGRVVWDGIELDITERKRAEVEREKLHAQLLQSQKMESIGRLAGGIAHDFNNMLGAILGNAELALARIESSNPIAHELREIRKAAERSKDLTRQLLAFARKQTIAPEVIDINETVEGMLKMLRRLIGEDIDLAWIPGRRVGRIKVDPSQLDAVLANLCVNARDAIGDTGRVTIETGEATLDPIYCVANPDASPGDYVLLSVSDDGCGMDDGTLARLFEPFFTTKEIGKGTGLGLATVYGIIKQNGGHIKVYSEPERGTTFRIYLPRHDAHPAVVKASLSPVAAPRGGETVLLVEDEGMILELTTQMLELLGYSVLASPTPAMAIGLAREHDGPIHLLMTDVVMPDMNGRDLAREVGGVHAGIRLLFMSGYTASVIEHHGVLDEGVHFIQKPFTLNDLACKVREVLDA